MSQSSQTKVLSYSVILTGYVQNLAQDLLALQSQLAAVFPYHELLLLSQSPIWDKSLLSQVGQVPNIRILMLEGSIMPELLERIALREAIGDCIILNQWPFEKALAENLLAAAASLDSGQVEYIGFRYGPAASARRLERAFEVLFQKATGYRPELSMAVSACYSRILAGKINNVTDYTTPIKLSNLVSRAEKHIIQIEARPRGLKKLIRRACWALEIFGATSPALLNLASFLCFLSALGSAAYAIYVFGIWIFKTNVMEGWTSSNLALSCLLFVLFFTLGLFSIAGSHILRKSQTATLPAVACEISRTDFIAKITSNVEME